MEGTRNQKNIGRIQNPKSITATVEVTITRVDETLLVTEHGMVVSMQTSYPGLPICPKRDRKMSVVPPTKLQLVLK